jgi:hypothetical protein
MKKACVAVGAIAGLAATLFGFAVTMGWIGPPDRYRLGPEALSAMGEYHELVAPLQTPRQAGAARDRERALFKRGNDLATEYLRTVRKEGKPDQHWEQFKPAFERFGKEVKQYDALVRESPRAVP